MGGFRSYQVIKMKNQSSLLDFTPTKIEERKEEVKKQSKKAEQDALVVKHLSQKSAQQILEGMRQ